MMRKLIKLIEETSVLPDKFWFNFKTEELVACDDHVSFVLENWQELNIPEAEINEWKEHLAQWEDDDEDFQDALAENSSDILELAMKYDWVRCGYSGPDYFAQHLRKPPVQVAAKFMHEMYNVDDVLVEFGRTHRLLSNNDLEIFIKFGRIR